MNEKRIDEFKGVILIAVGLLILASLVSFDLNDLSFHTSHPNTPPHNLVRTFGAYLAGVLLFLAGWASYIIPLFLGWMGASYFRHQPPLVRGGRLAGLGLLLVSVGSLIGLVTIQTPTSGFYRSGFIGFLVSQFIATYLGKVGGFIVLGTMVLLSLALATEVLISTFCRHGCDHFQSVLGVFSGKGFTLPQLWNKDTGRRKEIRINGLKPRPAAARKPAAEGQENEDEGEDEPTLLPAKPRIKIRQPQESAAPKPPKPVVVKSGDYQLPTMELLDVPVAPVKSRQIEDDLNNSARILEDTLADFGIAVKVTDIERGPIITRYELEPAPGVKVNRIEALEDDIALAMKAQSVRIIAPIPGKARVGVEVPNSQSSMVFLRDVIESKEFQDDRSKLSLALGKDISGRPVIADLAKMPHLLIAGTTGSGKTVCVNTIILSLLYRYSPNELKMLMIDPKMVELACFNGLPHLLAPVVTESKKASTALNWVVIEMERRYRMLSEATARNIEGYNAKAKEKLPFIIVFVDEFADLMVVARDQVENAVTRLAQLSRAVGIHLILATQRPSVDVITGVIKANLPARISFKVASKVDSRTVLDANGADKLIGKGDMLFLRPEDSEPTRAQGALVKDHEIEKVVAFIKSQAEPVYDETIVKEQAKTGTVGGVKDELYDEAVKIVMECNQASVSILQRRMRLGYTRAGRLIDMMYEEGLVGPYEGSKPRKILVDRQSWLEEYSKQTQQPAAQGGQA